ncbi:MAG: hypothetical protein HY843_03615 [Bdellovibrio sp.]|nr:hypothetical protein [Bdellovibrio sp.]
MINKNKVGRLFLLTILLASLISSTSSFASVSDKDLVVQGFGQTLDLLQRADLEKLLEKVDFILNIFKDPNIKQIREKSFSDTANWPGFLWNKEEDGDFTVSNGEIRRGFAFLKDAGKRALISWPNTTHATLLEMAEVLSSLQMNLRNPNKPAYSLLPETALRILDEATSTNVGTVNDGEAKNLPSTSERNLSKVDPEDSSFWSAPKNLENKNLTWGFDRTGPLLSGKDICEYDGAKSSYGTHPGFKMKCGDRALRVKFAEIRSQSFSTRILSALGYSIDEIVDPLNYIIQSKDSLADLSSSKSRVLRMKYDHRILSELHKRKQVKFDVTLFPGFLNIKTVNLTDLHNIDPFLRVQRGYLKEPVSKELQAKAVRDEKGGRWYLNGVERDPKKLDLKKFLLRNPNSPSPVWAGRDESNYVKANEDQVEQLVMAPVQVKTKEDSVGPWDFNELGHDGLRETRGLGLIAAWMGWHDVRFDNNRLGIVKNSNGQYTLKHYLHDTGSVLGESAGIVKQSAEDADRFPWYITLGAPQVNDLYGTFYFKVVKFNTLDECFAFEKMSLKDAQWGARLISRLSSQQIEQALLGAGFSAAETVLLRDKLLARRFMVLWDLGLGEEYAKIEKGPVALSLGTTRTEIDALRERYRVDQSKSDEDVAAELVSRGIIRPSFCHGGSAVACKVNFDPTVDPMPVAFYVDETGQTQRLDPKEDNYKVVNGTLMDVDPNLPRARLQNGDIVDLHPVLNRRRNDRDRD